MRPPLTARPLLLDFRGLEPAPERVLEIVDASLELPGDRLVIDWGERFPWRMDRAVSRVDAMAEQLVAAVGDRCSAAGRELAVLFRRALPEACSSRPAYRRLERARREPGSQWDAALRKAASDLLDDLRELLPSSAVCMVAGSGDAECLRDASAKSGIPYFEYEARSDEVEPDACLLGGIEERLVRRAHPAAGAQDYPRLHDSLREWRRIGWLCVARAHERVTEASGDPSLQGRALVESTRALARHVRQFNEIRVAFAGAYGKDSSGVGMIRPAPEDAVRRFLHVVSAPVREQHGQLAARTASLRASQ